jgi:cardiolipin synthase
MITKTDLPNILTLVRIAVLPVIVLLFYLPYDWAAWTIFVLFAMAAVTDYLDGYFARSLNSVSDVGKFLDPIADKLLVGVVLFMLAGSGTLGPIGLLAAVIIFIREITIAGLREYLGPKDVKVPVMPLAKWKTTVQLAAIGLLIIAPTLPYNTASLWIGEGLLVIAAGLTAVTGWGYLKIGLRHMLG